MKKAGAFLFACLLMSGCVAPNPELDAKLKDNVHRQVARCDAAMNSGNPPLMVYTLETGFPNSVGGVDITIGFVVTGQKPIKYVHFSVTAINRVGDPAVCSVRRSASQKLVFTGPANKGEWHSFNQYPCVVYNNTASFVRLDSVKVFYMDDTTEIFTDESLTALLTDPNVNDFAAGTQQRFRTLVRGKGYFEVSQRL